MDALTKQVGGNHYKELKIQPIEFIEGNKLSFSIGNIVKYLTRNKNRLEDLEKAFHYIEFNAPRKHHKILEACLVQSFIDNAFFKQFKHGKLYAQVVGYTLSGNTPKAKKLLRYFIIDGDYSEV